MINHLNRVFEDSIKEKLNYHLKLVDKQNEELSRVKEKINNILDGRKSDQEEIVFSNLSRPWNQSRC